MKISFSMIYSIAVMLIALIAMPIMFSRMNDTGDVGKKRKKKNNDAEVNQKVNFSKRKSSKKGQTIFELWGIESIDNGLMKLSGNRWGMVYRIVPVNFELLSDDEQSIVEMSLISTILSQDFPVQFISTAESVDTRYALQSLATAIQGEQSSVRRAYAQSLSGFLNELMLRRSILVRRNYLVLTCDEANENKARGVLDHRATLMASSLSRARVLLQPLTTAETMDLLAHFLNRNSIVKPSEALNHGGMDFAVIGKGVGLYGTAQKQQESYAETIAR